MERLFGEYLIKCVVNPSPEEEIEPATTPKEEVADPDDVPAQDAEDAAAEPFYPYEKISIVDAMVRTQITHYAVLFTSEYGPPCKAFQ